MKIKAPKIELIAVLVTGAVLLALLIGIGEYLFLEESTQQQEETAFTTGIFDSQGNEFVGIFKGFEIWKPHTESEQWTACIAGYVVASAATWELLMEAVNALIEEITSPPRTEI